MKFIGVILTRLTILLRVAWLLAPAIIFFLLLCVCTWYLEQGRDVMMSTLEKLHTDKIAWIVLIALLFWTLVTWYSSRVLVYRKPSLYENSKTIGFHAPRLLGFLGFSVAWIAIALIQIRETAHLPTIKNPGQGWLYLALSAAAYFVLYYLFKWLRDVKLLPALHMRLHNSEGVGRSERTATAKEQREHRKLSRIYMISILLVGVVVLLNLLISTPVIFFWSIIVLQLLFLFLVTIRRGALPYQDFPLDVEKKEWIAKWKQHKRKWEPMFMGTILYHLNVSFRERTFFYSFNIFSLIALFFYVRAIIDLDYANSIGSYALVLLAFGVLVGFFAMVSVLSLIKKINFHFVLLVLVFMLAKTREPHYVRQINAKSTSYLYAVQRPTLAGYFRKWTAQRKEKIEQSNTEYPVFFVLGDGGASRSGYWVAAALGRLEDGSQGKFSEHLFCLSGASGGVVGEGAFFSLLHHKNEMQGRSYEQEAKDYLRNDFLSFALARMLGPDFFRPLFPFNLRRVKDRAGALETALERGMPDSVFLKNKLAIPFSVYVTGRNDSIQLPILCINTTRMQDGRPGVISNINIHNVNERDSAFGPRLDVLDFIDTGRDLRLSTALMVGSRFPYVSPAGRIDERIFSRAGKPAGTRVHYFVDGGYFDNSGAGIVHEMLLELEDIKKGMIAGGNGYLNKLKFYVIHITNNPLGPSPLREVNYLSNDLFSPVITLIGTYTRQTDVNDWRLRKHIQLLYNTVSDTQYYKRIDLYKGINADTLRFPMNWAISGYYREKMDTLLNRSWQTRNLAAWMKSLR